MSKENAHAGGSSVAVAGLDRCWQYCSQAQMTATRDERKKKTTTINCSEFLQSKFPRKSTALTWNEASATIVHWDTRRPARRRTI